ncbi:uncharacterized protein [Linepithema humile]|uniref:uncharacterized protein n=1 Tax=Linepithema humile TaxID=83485 RepID=UPI00351F50C2
MVISTMIMQSMIIIFNKPLDSLSDSFYRTKKQQQFLPLFFLPATVRQYDLYYKCTYCNFMLPKENYDYLNHSCFANINILKENIYVDNFNCLFRVSEIDEQSCSSVGKKKIRNKEDKAWADYDELLINAVMKRPCLWNHITPPKTRGPLIVKEAWLEVKEEIENKFEVEIIKKRWRNLRDSYKKARNKMTEYIPSGSAAPSTENRKGGFRYYDQMEFLNDTMISRPNLVISMLINLLYCVSGPRKQSSDAEFKKDLLKILSEGSKTPDGVEGFLFQLGDILRKLPYKSRRQFEIKIMMDALRAEEEAGLL